MNEVDQARAAAAFQSFQNKLPEKYDVVSYRQQGQTLHMEVDHLFSLEDMIHCRGLSCEYVEDYDGDGYSWIMTADKVSCHINQVEKNHGKIWSS